MITDYEHMLISALRYAIGRRTYMVEMTVNYIIKEIPKLSDRCRQIMIYDIEHPIGGYGDACDKEDWMRLLTALEKGGAV